MKIYIPNISEQSIGGGWTFMRNFKKGMTRNAEFVDNVKDCDILMIVSASMVEADTVEEAYKQKKGIVFRVDNVPKKSRNKRGRIYDKMRRFGELADMIVFQSKWAMDYAGYLTGTEHSMVIYNGVDTDIFNQNDRLVSPDAPMKYLFVQYNRDENKRFPEAAYHFHECFKLDDRVELTVLGNFSPEMIEADFDFFANEKVYYIPPVTDPYVMAHIYKQHDVLLFPAFADAAPNTVLEARACGLDVALVNPIGGTREMVELEDISLDRMCREYNALFELIKNSSDIET